MPNTLVVSLRVSPPMRIMSSRKELHRQCVLDKAVARDPADTQTITQAENELEQAGVFSSYTSKALDEEIDHFEHKKLTDLRHVLYDFVKVRITDRLYDIDSATRLLLSAKPFRNN